MLGAAITVAGAFYVVNWQADADSRRYRSSLVAILEDAMRHIENCEKPTELYGETAPKMQKKHAEMAMKMINVAKRMTMQRVPDTPDLARAYMLIAEMDIDIEKLDEVLLPSCFYGGVTDVSECTKLTRTAVTSAIDRLKGRVS